MFSELEMELKQLLAKTDTATLARWWCELNHWNWPDELGEAEPRDMPSPSKRSMIMNEIMEIIGIRECLREWNKDRMSAEEFNQWFCRTFPGR